MTSTATTVRRILPYEFRLTVMGKLTIKNVRGQVLIVTRGEVEHILLRDDLDVHRRRMYEAAMSEFEKEDAKKAESKVQ